MLSGDLRQALVNVYFLVVGHQVDQLLLAVCTIGTTGSHLRQAWFLLGFAGYHNTADTWLPVTA